MPLMAGSMGPQAKLQNSNVGVVHVLMSTLAHRADTERKVMEILESPLKSHHCL